MPQFCIATVGTDATICNAQTVGDIAWCPPHNEARIKLYANYKSWHAALDASEDMQIWDIDACSSMKMIREWNEVARSRYGLLDRCIQAREQFTGRFFGNDMDFGHRAFWLSLVRQREELEALLARLEGRAYDLFLESQNASWVRERQSQESDHADPDEQHRSEVPPTHPTKLACSACQFEAAEAEISWCNIRWTIASYMLPTTSRYYEERRRVVWAYICRVIYTDPTLMLVALKYADVLSFLNDPEHDITTVRKLQRYIGRLSSTEVRAAIDDVLHPTEARGEYVTVLGNRIYKSGSGLKFPFHAWGHLFAFRVCPGCVRSLCQTVDEMVECSRYALFTGSAPFGYTARPELVLPAAEILSICGLVLDFPDLGKRISVTKRVNPDGTTIWEEDKHAPILYASLSPTDPKAHEFLNELFRRCLSHKSLDVMLRKGKTEPVIRSAADITNRFQRTFASLCGLRKQPWYALASFSDALLDVKRDYDGCQSRSTGIEHDSMQFALLDNAYGDADESYLVAELLAIWSMIYKAETLLDLCHAIAKPYLMENELELDHDKPQRPFLANGGRLFETYKALWGSIPKWLKDDEAPTYPTVWPVAEQMSN